MLAPLKSLFGGSKRGADSAAKRVLFMVPFGAYGVHHQLDCVLAAALQQRGCEVCLVTCDGIYADCDVLAWSGPNKKRDCRHCAKAGKTLFKRFGLPVRQLRDYLTRKDFEAAHAWVTSLAPSEYATAVFEDVPVGKWVTSSVFSYFRITANGLIRPEVQSVHREFLVNGVLTYRAFGRISDEFDPNQMCVFNARMAPYRVAYELACARGIEVLTHERGIVDDSFVLFDDQTCIETGPVLAYLKAFMEVPLTRAECLTASNYLAQREAGNNMNYPSFYSYRTEYGAVQQRLAIPPGVKVLGVFTSSEFELAYCDDFQSICNQLDVVDTLIDLFRTRPDYLVIRHHPYIGGTATSPPDHEFLSRAYRQARNAPANVRIIMPSEELSSYALFWRLDGCFAFFSTSGVEAAARGIATASFAESPFYPCLRLITERDHVSLDELIRELFQQTANLEAVHLRPAYRFLARYIARFSTRFKSFGIKNHFESALRFRHLSELADGLDPELDRICEHVIAGRPLVPAPSDAELNRTPREEDEFLETQCAEIRAQRQRIQQNSTAMAEKGASVVVVIQIVENTHTPGVLASWARSRYQHLGIQQLRLAVGTPFQKVFSALSGLLGAMSDSLIFVPHESIQYDESFLSSAVERLANNKEPQTAAVFSGAWISSSAAEIEGQVFTTRNPGLCFDDVTALLPSLADPRVLLALGLFRREFLARLVNELGAIADAKKAAATLFLRLQGPNIHRTQLPMLVIGKTAQPKPGAES